MDSVQELYETLVSFRKPTSDNFSPEAQLLNFCNKYLSSVEGMHYDYKKKRNNTIAILEDDDKKNLAKAVSGFANSSGGILIWGIENNTLSPNPIIDITAFTEALGRLAAQATEPPVRDIDVKWIPADPPNEGKGFALVYIPESALPPHRVILKLNEVQNHYYIRIAESFVVAPHVQLEDMFGRRPRPLLSLEVRMEVQPTNNSRDPNYNISVILGIRNAGRGIARAPFVSMKVHSPYHINTRDGLDGNGKEGLRRLITSPKANTPYQYGASADVVIHSGMVYNITSVPVLLRGGQDETTKKPLIIEWEIAAEGAQTARGRSELGLDDFENAVKQWNENSH